MAGFKLKEVQGGLSQSLTKPLVSSKRHETFDMVVRGPSSSLIAKPYLMACASAGPAKLLTNKKDPRNVIKIFFILFTKSFSLIQFIKINGYKFEIIYAIFGPDKSIIIF